MLTWVILFFIVCFCCVGFSFFFPADILAGKSVSEMTYFVSSGA